MKRKNDNRPKIVGEIGKSNTNQLRFSVTFGMRSKSVNVAKTS